MSSSNNSQSVPIANEYNARSPEARYKRTRNRTSTPVKFSTFAHYYYNTKPAKNSNEYQKRLKEKENEKLKAARKRNENRRKEEAAKKAAEKKAKEEAAKKVAAKKPTTLLEKYLKKLKNAKTRKELRKVFKEGALLFHPNKGGTTSNFQKFQNLFNELQKQF